MAFLPSGARWHSPTPRAPFVENNDTLISEHALDFLAALPRRTLEQAVVKFIVHVPTEELEVTWTPEEIIVRLESLSAHGKKREARRLLLEAEDRFPNERSLRAWRKKLDPEISLDTIPSGASVYRKLLSEDASEYEFLGTTPLKNCATYSDITTWKVEKEGYLPLEYIASELDFDGAAHRLFEAGELPENMLLVPSGAFRYWPQGWIAGIEGEGEAHPPVGDFLVDKYVVTNKEYKSFVDRGGYENEVYWREPILQGELELSWQVAITRFVDKTGKCGPATWENGTYPEHLQDAPVAGVSWFEAMAYARCMGKSLPSLYQWIFYACPGRAESLIASGNFEGQAQTPRDARMSMGVYGTFDTAGNVREWCASRASTSRERFIQGGAWNDDPQNFTRARTLDPFDRSPQNGIRCVKSYVAPIHTRKSPDRSDRVATSDDRFLEYSRIFEYEKTGIDTCIEDIEFHDQRFSCQKITTILPQSKERPILYLFLPRNAAAPYQTVLCAPSFWAYSLDSFEGNFGLTRCRFDFHLESGRAVATPVLSGMYGRPGSDIVIPEDAEDRVASLRREYGESADTFLQRIYQRQMTTISAIQEMRRHLDYLEARSDIDESRIGYHSVSLGAVLGPIIAALDTRIRAAVWAFGGLGDEDLLPETDPCVYLPRVTIPVLQLNGWYDYIFDAERSSKRWFDDLGTPTEYKKQIMYASGHNGPPENVLNDDSVAWLDEHLGAVTKLSRSDDE